MMMNYLWPIVIDLWRTTEFQKTILVNSTWTTCLEFAGVDGVLVARNHVFLNVWFIRGPCEAMWSVAIMGHALVPQQSQKQRIAWKPRTEDWQWKFESWVVGILAWVIFVLEQQNWQVGAIAHSKFIV
jgi:hypothetical protein